MNQIFSCSLVNGGGRGVATNNGLGGPNSNRDLFCTVSTRVHKSGIKVSNVSSSC